MSEKNMELEKDRTRTDGRRDQYSRLLLGTVVATSTVLLLGLGYVAGNIGARKNVTRAAIGERMGDRDGRPMMGQRPVLGEVNSISGDTMVIKEKNGDSIKVSLKDNPVIRKEDGSSGSKSDLKSGTTVMVVGARGSDGTVAARMIRINPAMVEGGAEGVNEN